MVAEGNRIFLKASRVKNCLDFETYRDAGAKSAIVHLRHNLPGERADVRKEILKQTAGAFDRTSQSVPRISASPDTGDGTPPPLSHLVLSKTKSSSRRDVASSSRHSTHSSSRHSTASSTVVSVPEVTELIDEARIRRVPFTMPDGPRHLKQRRMRPSAAVTHLLGLGLVSWPTTQLSMRRIKHIHPNPHNHQLLNMVLLAPLHLSNPNCK